VKLVLFTESDLAAGRATHEITLDPVANKTGEQTSTTVANTTDGCSLHNKSSYQDSCCCICQRTI
jgi:hypothetical protein